MTNSLLSVPIPPDLARKFRANNRALDRLLRERADLMAEAAEAKGSLREIAELAGVSHQTVANILKARAQR